MAKRKQSKAWTTFWVSVAVLVICGVPWLVPSCSVEPSVIWGHPPVDDDQDAGDSE